MSEKLSARPLRQRCSPGLAARLAVAICCVSASARAGSLQDVRDETHGKNAGTPGVTSSGRTKSNDSTSAGDESDDDNDNPFLSWVFYNLVSLPFVIPFQACGDTHEANRYFETYPYGGGAAGSMRPLDSVEA